ncbi:MAG TPA: HNH endonuclease domain-containing protein [Hanamia sp.]|nr:HNH endonuclease domain-containing protein [Hanamia sp.]
METKKVLGIDIGTNSIGAALINIPKEFSKYGEEGNIEWAGSRIIPTDGDYLQKFESGAQAQTKAAFRRGKRGSRRLKHRYKLRRTRLIKVAKALGWLDENFPLDDSRGFKKSVNENGYSLKISNYLPFSDETIVEFEKEFAIDGKKSKKGKSIVPEDWIIYFLRKKALTRRITIPELLRIIYMLNQRRGFKSSRKDLKTTNVLPYGEFVEKKDKNDFGEEGIETQFVVITKIKSVTFKEEKKDKKGISNIYTIVAEDTRLQPWEETRKKEPDWAKEINDKGERIERKEFTFLVTQKIDKTGKFTQNKPQLPKDDDWALCTTALSEKIEEKHQHPGEYFYEQIKEAYLAKRNFKARQYPVYRWRYQKELEAMWNKQCALNPELQKINADQPTLIKLAELLYPTQAKNNMPKLAEFKSSDLLHIISKDIIYYQRELKSQKNSISECRYEKRKGIDGEYYGLKCIPRSSPLFQEFRIWQDVHNIRVLEREVIVDGKTKLDVDVTSNFIDDNLKAKLFELFNSKASVSEKDILKLLKENYPDSNIKLDVDKKEKIHSHRINLYARREELKGNETLSRYRTVFKKADFDGETILSDKEKLLKLWHIDYSITSFDEEKSKKGITNALTKLLSDSLNKGKAIELFTKLSELKKEYGSYSSSAIKKMLPVMRCGQYWQEQDVTEATKQRAEDIKKRLNDLGHNMRRINEIADDDVQKQVLKSLVGKDDLTKGLNTYQAGYLIYDKHSEKDKISIASVEDFGKFIQKEIPNNSLRNPVVEQVVRETMFLVRDVWNKYGEIDEIHIELGRNLKNNSQEREKISKAQDKNFNEKQRIKKLLYELMNGEFNQYTEENEIENVNFEVRPNPESPVDIDKFRIWRNLSKQSEVDWAKKVKDEKIPTEQELKKYALWLSQNCRSPYTGKIIPLSKLFDTNQYEIEHAIPRSKMKNDNFNNLVIAEWGVNKAKDKLLAANFISDSKGKCKYGDVEYKLFTYEEYEAYCKDIFRFQKAKLKNLLATEVPEDFIERQLNDTRYIGRKLAELLTPVTKNENGIIFTGGAITSELKNNWGLNKVWKELIKPRFERLERITGNQYIVHDKDDYGNPVIHFNVKENEQLDLKRIDHRHHALDALIIAATTREHIRYLNTLSAADTDEEIKNFKRTLVKGKIRDFKTPWESFTKDAKDKLEETIVTFKTNNKIISAPKNRTAYLKVENGKAKREYREQQPNKKWMAVRRSMFKEPQGIVYLKEVYEEKSILKAIEIQINKMLVQNTPAMKLQSYVYDKEAREIIRALIDKIGISIQEKKTLLDEIKKYIKKNPLKDFTGNEYKTIRVAEFIEYAAKRVSLDDSFDHKKINKIPYGNRIRTTDAKGLSIPQLLHQHLSEYEEYSTVIRKVEEIIKEYDKSENKITGNSDEAEKAKKDFIKVKLSAEDFTIYEKSLPEPFKGEGLEQLAKKAGKPITKVTIAEKKDQDSKFGKQYVEVDKGSNAYFVMYENQQTKEREGFESIATHKAIENLVQGKAIAEDREGFDKIVLSPDDLVYVPTIEEIERLKKGTTADNVINWNNQIHLSQRIYKVVSFSKKDLLCVKADISDYIIPYDRKTKSKGEIGWDNKSTNTMESDVTIKDICIKLKVDRLGNISH